jgi:2-polyprenyl-6-methoxyphenol hydroxylase-like FAD-dependent oxidoreductase
MIKTTALIVGAGPTGLVAAVGLAQAGIPFLIVDAASAPAQESRAALVHSASIEILDQLGAAETLVAAGQRIDAISIHDSGRRLGRLSFDRLPSAYPFALGVPQSTTERILNDRLRQLGHSVNREVAITALRNMGDQYLVHARRADGQEEPLAEAQYVVGADGAHSVVRRLIGQEFRGSSYDEDFVLADVELSTLSTAANEASITFSTKGVTVLCRLPSGRHRIVASTSQTSTPRQPDRAYIDDLLSQRGMHTSTASDPAWSSRFRLSHRVVDQFRVGGVFLAGDAAHVHSPAAGQGMNTGMADGLEIARTLSMTTSSKRKEECLDAYASNRRVAALEVLKMTDRMTRAAFLSRGAARGTRNLGIRSASRVPPLASKLTLWASGLKRSPLR